MRVTADGNIGIGTTTPTQKLDVAETITVTKLISTGNAEFNSSTPLLYMGSNKTSGIYSDIRQKIKSLSI